MSTTSSFSNAALVNFFGEDTIKNRIANLYQKMTAFIEDCGLTDSAYVNVQLLRRAVVDYFADIYRLRTFHGIKAANRHKIVAYTSFWILRRQPIQLLENATDEDKCAFVNENFVACLIAYSCVTPSSSPELMYNSRIILDEDGEKVFVRFLSDLKYHMRYRMVDARNLELLLSAYETGFSLGSSNYTEVPV